MGEQGAQGKKIGKKNTPAGLNEWGAAIQTLSSGNVQWQGGVGMSSVQEAEKGFVHVCELLLPSRNQSLLK